MAAPVWLPASGKFFLPPQKPYPKVQNTDEYVTTTNIYFYASTDRMLVVGHPYYPVHTDIPKVSANQYRVMRVLLPDPNKFALIDPDIYNSEEERLVWKLKGIEIDRGGPLGVGSSGHPLFNKQGDTENPLVYALANLGNDLRLNVSHDPKQTQLFIVGCKPAVGEHWDVAESKCDGERQNGDCPAIQLAHTTIQDGDMGDIGWGAVNFKALQQDLASVPLDLVNETSKWPDFIRMAKDVYGDYIFFYTKREQVYARHFANRAGEMGDPIPTDQDKYYHKPNGDSNQATVQNSTYFTIPSGSLTSSDAQLFNRPYWLQRAQGANNGICWNNELFITVFDNTHNTNINISVYKNGEIGADYTYNAADFKQYLRHAEEFEVEFVFQLCKVRLDADVLAHLNVMNPSILENWDLAFMPPAPSGIEDTYRYLKNLASGCPVPSAVEKEKEDPYKNFSFWNINLQEKFTTELSQYPLGKRFLYQMGLMENISPTRKRVRTDITVTARKTTKKRRLRA